jgi:hypothetical protein
MKSLYITYYAMSRHGRGWCQTGNLYWQNFLCVGQGRLEECRQCLELGVATVDGKGIGDD